MYNAADKNKNGYLEYDEVVEVLKGFVQYLADSGYKMPNPNEETY